MNIKNTITLITAAAVLAGCATAHIFTGAALQVTACELAKAKPAAKAPLHAAGVAFKAFAADTPPTQAQLAQVLAAIPKADSVTQVEVDAAWVIVVQAYGLIYSTAPETQAKLKLWFAAVGNALDAGSTCGSADPQSTAARYMQPPKDAPTFRKLADEIAASLKDAR